MYFSEILTTLLPIIGIGVFFFFYYKSPTVREKTKVVLRFAPMLLSIDDVENDLFEFVRSELDRLWKMGMTNVPDINDEVLRTHIKVVFTSIQEAFSEDTTGDDSQS